jgi:hypothetical protein
VVEYKYRPRDPRAKLREVTTKWTASMRVAGRAPNCGVIFGEGSPRAGGPDARGWLVGDRRPGAVGDRYLIMDDGDVWRARAGASPALDSAVAAWLAEPDDDLVMLLARALGDARLGGAGWLEVAGSPERVDDRRREPRRHDDTDRREG